MDKKDAAIVVLAILLIGAFVYIGKVRLGERQAAAYQFGFEDGSQAALIQIIDKTGNCLTVPLTFQNKTITLIAAECLSQNSNS